MAYDTKCFDLAEAFLEDEPQLATPKRTAELAQLIQTTIEDFISYERNHAEPPDPPGFEAGFADTTEEERHHVSSRPRD